MLKKLFFIPILLLYFISCQDDVEIQKCDVRGADSQNSCLDLSYMPTKTIQDSLENVEAYEINNFDDLYIPMLEAKEIFKDALNRGIIKNSNSRLISSATRAGIVSYNEYETIPLVVPEDVHQRMYFKSKFSAAVVNKINAVVMPEGRISTGTTYCCYWDIFYHDLTIDSNQRFGYVSSPQCALLPSNRNQYIDRGYEMEKTEQSNGKVLYELYSFQLRILYKDGGATTYLGLMYPRIIDPSPWLGYKFSYNVLTL